MNNLLVLFLLAFSSTLIAQDLDRYQKKTFVARNGELPYRIMLPKHYNPDIQYPLVLFLHGSGERGSDNSAQLKHGGALFASDSVREDYPAFVVFPQCPLDGYWTTIEYTQSHEGVTITYPRGHTQKMEQDLLEGLLKELKKTYSIDKKRLYIGGLSMGAMGTFELVRRNPRTFAAAFAICGGANPAIVRKIDRQPWWIFHGKDDQVVPIKYAQQMVDALQRIDADVQFTVYPDLGHDSWTATFANPGLLAWLFAQSKK